MDELWINESWVDSYYSEVPWRPPGLLHRHQAEEVEPLVLVELNEVGPGSAGVAQHGGHRVGPVREDHLASRPPAHQGEVNDLQGDRGEHVGEGGVLALTPLPQATGGQVDTQLITLARVITSVVTQALGQGTTTLLGLHSSTLLLVLPTMPAVTLCSSNHLHLGDRRCQGRLRCPACLW